MNKKYEFLTQPPKGKFGKWQTKDGYQCFTDQRSTATRWYKKWLNENRNQNK